MEKRLAVHLRTKNTLGNNKKRKVDEVDRMSELPDHILGLILSHLSLKEAARTSTLSARWRDVWIIRDTVLDFHDRPRTIRDCDSMATPIEFIDRVDKVLEKHKEPTLSEFIVKSDWLFNSTLSERIFNWIYVAIRKRVQRLDLALSSYHYLSSDLHKRLIWSNGSHRSSPCHSHSFPSLSFLLSKVEGFSRFVITLRVLRLRCFNVDDELLAYLLSNCPVLEHLSVSFSKTLVNLQVRAPSTVKLKYFEIHRCHSIKTIHFDDAPNLEFIRCFQLFGTISIKSAPKLINVSLGGNEEFLSRNLWSLSNNSSQLEVLTLESVEVSTGVLLCTFLPYPIFIHTKQLILSIQNYESCHLDLNSLLIAMPSLYRLHLMVGREMFQLPWSISKCSHNSLKLVEWDGFTGDYRDYDFVKYLVETCKVLEKVIITKGYSMFPVRAETEKLTMQLLEGVEVIIQKPRYTWMEWLQGLTTSFDHNSGYQI